ncbi:bifunctional DNA primase/polymerase [Paracoccus alkanivorans]|uniref:DNA primase/polymerase bifunctional N-terminal domain-containing protein n=1 Tax=Paracoccus alkanivorans TaxID=2116655 RepID=A0A3M0MCN7_9RHOB|nr:bifunctional DNA primase/polymerase [Paracoccus alkanivorans]RMC35371.1 hypothetical protein C9E81_09015 [Paracoccus alkanivorans]
MGIYAQHAPIYAAAGLPVFPVDVRNKKPAVKNWQNATPRQSRGWASSARLAANDGLGIVMGKPSGITEIDVDAVGDAWVTAALERFGQTPVVIRTASGKAKLWYRHNGEGRHVRPFNGLPIDVLGGGFTIAPPSFREDLGASYAFRTGGIEDVCILPTIKDGALSEGFTRAPEAVQRGERNDSLWRYCMSQARHCDDVEALIDVALTWTSAFPEPLPPQEAEACARSAWGYETTGRNYLGLKKPQLTKGDKIMDDLLDAPRALVLLQMFQRWHRTRPFFAIAPRAMSEAGTPPWPRRQIEHARDVLMDRGYIVEVIPPRRGVSAGHYRLADEMPKSAHNHNTFPPSHIGAVSLVEVSQ